MEFKHTFVHNGNEYRFNDAIPKYLCDRKEEWFGSLIQYLYSNSECFTQEDSEILTVYFKSEDVQKKWNIKLNNVHESARFLFYNSVWSEIKSAGRNARRFYP